MTATPQGKYPYAGIPRDSTTFGRDGLITALQMLWFDPSVARGVLQRLAHFQADRYDAASDAQPGKILHEMRSGEMAALGEVPFRLCITAASIPPRCLCCLPRLLCAADGRRRLPSRNLAQHRTGARLDRRPRRPRRRWLYRIPRHQHDGLANQGWKDSTTPSSTPMASWPRTHPPGRRRRAMSMQPGSRRRIAPAGLAITSSPKVFRQGGQAARALRGSLLVRGPGNLCAGPRWVQRAMPRAHQQCRPHHVHGDHERGQTGQACGRRHFAGLRSLTQAGAFAQLLPARSAITRCRIITDRSGRMTMQ